MNRLRYVTIVALAVNLVLLAVNGWIIDRNRELLSRLRMVSDAQREWVSALPPHRCGSVILPGERCEVNTRIMGPTF